MTLLQKIIVVANRPLLGPKRLEPFSLSKDHPDLERWLEEACKPFSYEVERRITEGVRQQYREAATLARGSGASDDEAHRHAMAALGDPIVKRRNYCDEFLTECDESILKMIREPYASPDLICAAVIFFLFSTHALPDYLLMTLLTSVLVWLAVAAVVVRLSPRAGLAIWLAGFTLLIASADGYFLHLPTLTIWNLLIMVVLSLFALLTAKCYVRVWRKLRNPPFRPPT